MLRDPDSAGASAVVLSRTTLKDEGRDLAFELRRFVYGELRSMFDGPTSPGVDLTGAVVVLDLAALYNAFGVMPNPVYCTKIASRLARTYTDRHGLKDLVREVLNIDLSKQQQSSDWGSSTLSEAQLAYASSDVLHLHGLRERLDAMLAREGRAELAKACFEFLPTRSRLDLDGWEAEDIFAHS